MRTAASIRLGSKAPTSSVSMSHKAPMQKPCQSMDFDGPVTMSPGNKVVGLVQLTSGLAPTVAIVDPFSTGKWLAPGFAQRGWSCVAVLSGTVSPEFLRGLCASDFAAVVLAQDGLEALAAELSARGVQHVVAGSEWGVNLAEDLADYMGFPGNDPLPGRPRRDKYRMASLVREKGLRAPLSLKVMSSDDLDSALDQFTTWPIVLKPTSSGGSDGVCFCESRQQAREVFDVLLGDTNVLGLTNDSVLVQERLVGQQYFVNSVSIDGRHHIHEIWRDDRIFVTGKPVYDRQVLLDAAGPVQAQLQPFVRHVLDALGVRNGPAHTELCVDEHGPALIESGARLEGSVTPSGPVSATGTSQVALTVERYTEPEEFAARIGTGYKLDMRLAVVCLVAPRDGAIDADVLDTIRALPSVYCGSALELPDGMPVSRTVDLLTSPGHIYLLAHNSESLEGDYRAIRELETNGLYLREM